MTWSQFLRKILSMFQFSYRHKVDEQIQHLENQSREIQEHLARLADKDDPFADLVRTMRQASRKRGRNGHVV